MSDPVKGAPPTRGRLKIFLGYAAGVGKTFKMLDECQRLKQQGRDIVVGYFEPHGRQGTIAKVAGLEVIPRRRIHYRGRSFEEMDMGAIVHRRPDICAVDEFPHSNVPGSLRAKRWEDVVVLLEAGIDVLTTMNIQHLESLNDRVREIAGIEVRETIPDWIVRDADEVVLIDLPPQALLNRLARGVVYAPDKAAIALESFFKESTLAALREMALRQTAHEVDVRQSLDVARPAPDGPVGAGDARERILIHVTKAPATAALIRRGRRVADYLKADCFAVAVLPPTHGRDEPQPSAGAIAEHLAFARRLHIETRQLEGRDVARALVEFARGNGVTQIFVSKPEKRPLPLLQGKGIAMRVVELAEDMQVTVVAERHAQQLS
jgi:two-component system, OmpR family, sensor histidine kinase KdpD